MRVLIWSFAGLYMVFLLVGTAAGVWEGIKQANPDKFPQSAVKQSCNEVDADVSLSAAEVSAGFIVLDLAF